MKYPDNIQTSRFGSRLEVFGGINRRIKTSPGEFRDMENLLPAEYPCLSSSPMPEAVISQSNIAKWFVPRYVDADVTKFSGMVKEDGGYRLYINGERIKFSVSDMTDVFDFNGRLITIPTFRGYDYLNGENIEPNSILQSLTFTRNNDVSFLIEFETNVAKRFRFKEGDSIVISGGDGDRYDTFIQTNNHEKPEKDRAVSVTVIEVNDKSSITVIGYDADGEVFDFTNGEDSKSVGTRTITLRTPSPAYACMNKNRVWVLGESGETIYASELGLPFQFYNYGVTATDAWYGDVGTPGKFTGIGTYQDRVLAFKEDEVHIVYGDVPSNFSIFRNYSIGCIDGKSIANVGGGILIWLYHDGFYAYSGGKPQRISDKLNTKYVSCVAFADNKRYYARCVKEDGTAEMLVYDTDFGLWSKIGVGRNDTQVVPYIGGEYYGGVVYTYDSGGVYKLFGEEYGDFYAESAPMTFDTYRDKSVLYLHVRTIIENGFLNVYTSVNGGEWVEHKGINTSSTASGPPSPQGEGFKSKLPIRYSNGDSLRLRLEGCGKVTVIDIGIEMIEN